MKEYPMVAYICKCMDIQYSRGIMPIGNMTPEELTFRFSLKKWGKRFRKTY